MNINRSVRFPSSYLMLLSFGTAEGDIVEFTTLNPSKEIIILKSGGKALPVFSLIMIGPPASGFGTGPK